MRKGGQPILGVTISQSAAPTGTLAINDLTYQVDPFVGENGQPVVDPNPQQQRAATLNYLCETNGDVLPPPNRFSWNWIDANEMNDYDGVVSINRNTLAAWFKNQLQPYVEQNCYYTSVYETPHHWETHVKGGQIPTITMPATDSTVVSFIYHCNAHDQAGVDGFFGKMWFNSSFSLDVKFQDNTIITTQYLIFYFGLNTGGIIPADNEGNIVDRTITDTYTLGVSADGRLVVSNSPKTENFSQTPQFNGWDNFFSGNQNETFDKMAALAKKMASSSFGDIPLSVVQDFVFPGGRTFAFKSVSFSQHQDLVAHITYTDPT